MRRKQALLACAIAGAAVTPAPASAQGAPVLLRDSFAIGSGDGILCQVQDRSVGNPARQTMFDRRWAVVCRDSALPVSTVFAFRGSPVGREALIAPLRRDEIDCSAAGSSAVADVAGALRRECTVSGTALGWSIFEFERGGTTYVAEGFSAYDSATLLALRSLADNALADGRIDAATTSVGDPIAFARVQAETLKPQQALAEGYRRNLGGDYAEAAAYFETLQKRVRAESGEAAGEDPINPGEFLVNRALQKSNLGDFAEADRLFIDATAQSAGDPVTERLQRNFEAIHLLNQGYPEDAIERLDTPLSAKVQGAADLETGLEITIPIASRLNAAGEGGLFGFADEFTLSPLERAEIIDAQAMQLKGTALRLLDRDEAAKALLLDAYARAMAVRDGRVTSLTRLRAQAIGELGSIAERQGDGAAAESYLRNALALIEADYPERRAVSGARARLAGLMLRQGREGEAVQLYRQVLDAAIGRRDAMTGFANQLAPFFRLAAGKVESDPAFAEDFFKASQLLIRPGVAETQAILARELSANSDEAARLFRQSVDLARDIERLRIGYQALSQDAMVARDEMAARIASLEQQQQRTQASLSAYPQYRVVAPSALSLADFRETLQPGEAYARLAIVGGEAYMFYADRERARAWKAPLNERALAAEVDLLRASISMIEGGRYVTYPYEIASARKLYRALFEPVAPELAQVRHLIFEPDGPLLRLPVDILVADDASVAAYQAQMAAGGDPFDLTGVNWLGRTSEVSTAVSAQAFVDARRAPRSRAAREYLGLGNNAPIGGDPSAQIRAQIVSGDDQCGWTVNEWNRPVDPAELIVARRTVGDGASELLTGATFTDQAIKAKTDLDQFRILHFATHGLVTPPAPTCPARPALLTSFGDAQSDGLLSFEEIFDLDLDADLVILSACDTAGAASIEATREAGVGSGGGTALDGLVRAFIGAGGRAVLASHWPAPDQYDATERLMNGLFEAGRTRDLGGALRASQQQLMDDPQTSHPYYWGGFAIVGDAARPLLSEATRAEAARAETVPAVAVAGS